MRAIELDQWLAREAPPHTPEDEVDGIMAGDPEAEVTGIAVTWLPNMDVLERAADRGLNFVLAHEPVYYHHPYFYPYGDDYHTPASDLPDKMATPPGERKQRLISQHNLVVHRFHDGWDQFPEYGMGMRWPARSDGATPRLRRTTSTPLLLHPSGRPLPTSPRDSAKPASASAAIPNCRFARYRWTGAAPGPSTS